MFETILAAVIPATIVGFGGAWLASQKAMASFNVRLVAVEKAIDESRGDHDLLVELKTKMDLILSNLLQPTEPK